VEHQLRIYSIRPGEMEAWIAEWKAHIVRLRQRHGFEIAGAWTTAESNRFVWVLAYGGPKTWEQANADYYASADRVGLDPDPARHIISTEEWLMSDVSPD
jgi:hypothetical protein